MEGQTLSVDITAPEGIPEKEYEPRHHVRKPESPLKIFGKNLRERRLHRKLTIKKFAKMLGVSVKTYMRIANGTGNPTYETLLRIAIALGISIHITPSSK